MTTTGPGRSRIRVQAVKVSASWTPSPEKLAAIAPVLFGMGSALMVRGGRLTINANFRADLSDPDQMIAVAAKVRGCRQALEATGELHHFSQSTGTVEEADLSPETGAVDAG